nr:MAG TPA: NB glycoprotein [Caudoviricetes sp.]
MVQCKLTTIICTSDDWCPCCTPFCKKRAFTKYSARLALSNT